MKSDREILEDQNNQYLLAQAGGHTPSTTGQTSALVFVETDEEGNKKPKVRRRWLMGDPWTDDFYFAEWRTDEQISEESKPPS